jgi:formylglycine-generating enzyme required for sulfatase activity
MDWVVVDDPNNAADTNGTNSGSVSYEYSIGKYEVTVSQYCEFLNAVATTDSHSLYYGQMDIGRSGSSGSYTYSADSGKDEHPVGYITWLRALRFINWMHNDQPIIVDPNDPDPATEDGAYTLSGDNPDALRNPGAAYFLPNIDEWYKAAFYDPCTSSYWSYATSNDTLPTSEDPPGGTNSVNCDGSDTTAVGAYLDSIGPYGTFDQNGNVEEWLEADISSDINKPVYGGRYNDSCPSSSDASVKLYTSTWHTNGFRVAASSEEHGDPDPVCLSYLVSDLNRDCEVNLLDFAIMAGEWLICSWDQPEYCSQ